MTAEAANVTSVQNNAEKIYAGLFLLYPIGMASIRHYSSAVLVLMVLTAIVLAVKGRKNPSAEQFYIIGGILLLIAAALLSFVNAEDMNEGLKRLEKLIDLFCLLPLFYGARNCRYDLGKKYLIGLLIAAPVNLGIAAFSIWGECLPRAQGYYNPIIFGDLMMLSAMLLLVLLVVSIINESGRGLTWIWLALFAFVLTSFFSGTRGALLAVPPVVLMLFWCCRRQFSLLYLKRLGIPAVIIVLTVVVLGISYGGSSGMIQRCVSIVTGDLNDSESAYSDSLRLEMWKYAGRLFVQYPVIGTGLGDFRAEIVVARQTGLVQLDRDYTHAHSIYLEYLGMTGLVGFVAMLLALFVIPIASMVKAEKFSADQQLRWLGALAVLVCFAAFGLTENWLARSSMVTSFVVSLAAFFPVKQVQEQRV